MPEDLSYVTDSEVHFITSPSAILKRVTCMPISSFSFFMSYLKLPAWAYSSSVVSSISNQDEITRSSSSLSNQRDSVFISIPLSLSVTEMSPLAEIVFQSSPDRDISSALIKREPVVTSAPFFSVTDFSPSLITSLLSPPENEIEEEKRTGRDKIII